MEVTEIIVPSCMCALTTMDRIKNEYIRGRLRVTNVTGRRRKNGSRWFGYVDRKNNDERT